MPDETRLRKASHKADRAALITYGGRGVDVWWRTNAEALKRFENLEVWQITPEDGAALAGLAERKMKFSCTLQEGTVYFEGLELHPVRLQ